MFRGFACSYPNSILLCGQGLDPSKILINSNNANGCAVVTPLPSAASFVRIAYKFYFAVTASQWASISTSLIKANTIKAGHVECGSTLYFQTYPLGTITTDPINATNYPQVRDPGSSGTLELFCRNDA